ncbi:MAG: helicase-exonuclease AddAB subunit AddA [Tissierellia bacterium]|nr:helicase-exonuclease AddAB subunit AddA [Tissierellia bacterium]
MNWTDEQQRIIELKNSNLLVSAAAGSGKTAVMVERIITLIKNGEDIDRFLVVTFTKAAAAGMKKKIQSSLVKAYQGKKGNVKHLRKQLSLLNRSMITTIDSFCMDVVKKNFHLVDVDPNFRVGDNSELSILLQESIDEALEEEYGNINENENFRKLVEGFTGNRGDDELSDIIQSIYKFILSFPDPFAWLSESVEKLHITGEELKNSKWFDEIKSHIMLLLDGSKGYINMAIEICNEPHGPALYLDTLKKDMDLVENLEHLIETDTEEFMRALKDFKAPRAASFKEEDNPNVDIEKQIEVSGSKNNNNLRAKYKGIISSIKKLLPYDLDYDKYALEINEMHGSIATLRDLIIKIDKIYKEKKNESSIADFNDLEHFALNILRSINETGEFKPSETAEYYRKKYNYIFIDEYQDSNSLQEAIIEQIKRDNNLFMVGDVKQSIYRFRLADPSIFNNKYSTYAEDSNEISKDTVNRKIDLNKNFRSRDEILKAVNFVFKNIMSKELGEVEYDEKAALNTGTEFSVNTPVELHIIHKNASLDGNGDDEVYSDVNENNEEVKSEIQLEIESMETAELEALFASMKIKELLKEEICIPGKSEHRKIEYKDIVILLRSVVNWAGIFEERFNKEDIPFYYDGGKGYYEALEVKIVVNLLKLIDNIRQDIPLLSVMRSPIGNFKTEELLEIRLKYPKEKHFIGALSKYIFYEKDDNEPVELVDKLKNFTERIYDWSYRSRYSHLNDLIWDILMETNYYNFVGALPNGRMRQANLRMLADLAYNFEKTSMRGLFKFLRYIEKIGKGYDDRGQAKTLGENDNVVRLMSIHKSKGLEFPVVILCGLNKQFNLQDARNKILMHKEHGIAPKFVNVNERTEKETLARTAIKLKIKKENISEEMRVLYVAMTRAIDRLIVAGTVSNLEQKQRNWRRGHSKYSVYKGLSYMDWICSCLFEKINYEYFNEIIKSGQWKNWNLKMITRSELSLNASDDLNLKESKIAAMNDFKYQENSPRYEEIGRRLSFKYPHMTSVNVPAKLSVTELKNLENKEFSKLRYRIPTLIDIFKYNETDNKFILDKEITGAEVGTLLHLVMEHLDLKGDLKKSGIINTIKQMEDKKLLTEAEAKIAVSTYAEKIEEFFQSKVGKRILNSSSVYREAPFVFRKKAIDVLESLNEEDLILVQGIIDCYFIEDGEAVIVDYKTDKIDETKNIAAQINKLKEEYYDQVSLYKEAVEKITGINVKECYLYLFSMGREEVIILSSLID